MNIRGPEAPPMRVDVTPTPPLKWRERWYGSNPDKGSAIVDERGNLIAFFGGDEATHKATTAAVSAHNAALAHTARPDAGDEVEQLRAALAAKPWPPSNEDLRKMLGHIVGAWWSNSTGKDLIEGKVRLNPQDIKGMYAVRDALAPYVATAAMREGVDRGMVEHSRVLDAIENRKAIYATKRDECDLTIDAGVERHERMSHTIEALDILTQEIASRSGR